MEEDIKLFCDVLFGLFFVMMGMLFDLCVIWEYLLIVFGFFVG